MLRKLDPHTSFLPPEAYARMRDRQQSSFFGLGILVGMRDDKLTVISPLEGTPASRMGIRAGDIITTIEGESTADLPLDDAVMTLKGPKDTAVTITLARRGVSTPLELTIKRAEIPLTTVRYVMMIAPGTGYFRVTEFSRSTGKEVADAIASLREQGMKRLLLDLRNNGGGLLDQAIAVADHSCPRARPSSRPAAASATPSTSTRRKASTARSTCRLSCSSTAARRRRPRSSPGPSRTTTSASSPQPTWGKGLVQTSTGCPTTPPLR